jgi:hypothetical protein
MILFAAWPTSTPFVCTAYWDQAAWNINYEGERPEGYTGDMFDYEEYAKFAEAKRKRVDRELREEYYSHYGMRWDAELDMAVLLEEK